MSTNVKRTTTKGLLPDYYSNLTCEDVKKRYREKLTLIKSLDPYEIPKNEWLDDTEKWPSVSYIHVGMYLLFSESPYTKDQLLNYKSLDSYEKFANGWVREVLVKEFAKKRLMIAKVCDTCICFILYVCCFWCKYSCKSYYDKIIHDKFSIFIVGESLTENV